MLRGAVFPQGTVGWTCTGAYECCEAPLWVVCVGSAELQRAILLWDGRVGAYITGVVSFSSQVIAKEKKEAEEGLAAALPALEEARLALTELDKNDVTEIRSADTPMQCLF